MIDLRGNFNGKEIKLTLTEDILKQLIKIEDAVVEKISTGYERAKQNEPYFTIDNFGTIKQLESGCGFDNELYEKANYFLSEELALQEDKIQTLRRKLKRFSNENGGNEIDWNNTNQKKYSLFYSLFSNNWLINDSFVCFNFENVYFISKKIAEKALETFENELKEIEKYFI